MSDPSSKVGALGSYLMWSGSLFHLTARIETNIAFELRMYITHRLLPGFGHDLGEAVKFSAAIYNSNRLAGLRDTFKRLLRTTNPAPELTNYVNALFSQLGEIQWLRDRLAHQATEPASDPHNGWWINEEDHSARDILNSQPIMFDLYIIMAAVDDCIELATCFGGILYPYVINKPGAFDLTPPSWQYKPSLLVRGHQAVRQNLKSPQPPRPIRGWEPPK